MSESGRNTFFILKKGSNKCVCFMINSKPSQNKKKKTDINKIKREN